MYSAQKRYGIIRGYTGLLIPMLKILYNCKYSPPPPLKPDFWANSECSNVPKITFVFVQELVKDLMDSPNMLK